MEKFEYQAKDSQNKAVKGIVEAASQKQAAKILREKGFLVIDLKPKKGILLQKAGGGIFDRVGSSEKVNFTRQLATMMNAGLAVTNSLRILEAQSKPALGKVVGEILRQVEGGSNLADAMERHPEVFDPTYVALIRAGEAAGVLNKVLNRLADNLEKQKSFKGKVTGALIYPAIVVIGMVLVAAVMVIFVIPKMTSLYEEFQAELPLPTKILLGISRFATQFWWLALIMLVGLFFLWRFLSKMPWFRRLIDRILFKLPIIGKLRQQIMLAEFSRTLGLLVGTGILIVEALEIVRRAVGSLVYQEALAKVSKEVERGLPLATSLARAEVFPPILAQMTSVGEETGKIDEVLVKVSSYFESESDNTVKGLTSALEPLIMIVLGVGVAFLVISIIMPIYNLTTQI